MPGDVFNEYGQLRAPALQGLADRLGQLEAAYPSGAAFLRSSAGQVLVQPQQQAPGLWVRVTSATPQTVTLAGGATVSGYPALVESYGSVTGAWSDGAACWFVGANAEAPTALRYLVGLAGFDAAGKGIYSTEVPAAAAYGLASGVYIDTGLSQAIAALTITDVTLTAGGGSQTIANSTPAGQSAVLANAAGLLNVAPAGTYLVGGYVTFAYSVAPAAGHYIATGFTAPAGGTADPNVPVWAAVNDNNYGAGGAPARQHLQLPIYYASGVSANSLCSLRIYTDLATVTLIAAALHAVRLL